MILITGASGRVARRAAELLAERGASLRLMSRRPDKVPQLQGAEILAGDFRQPHTLDPAFARIDVAFIVSAQAKPGVRALLHRNAFEAAARAGVRHVVYLSLMGASEASAYPFCRDHKTSERFLADTGLSHTILRVAFYQDMFIDKVDPAGTLHELGGDGCGAFISREDTAWAVAAAVTDTPSPIQEITGPELISVRGMARRLSAISGIELREDDETVEGMRKRLGRAGKPVWMQDLEVGWFQAINAGEQSPVSPDFKNLVGREPQTLEAYCTAFPDRLRALRRTCGASPPRDSDPCRDPYQRHISSETNATGKSVKRIRHRPSRLRPDGSRAGALDCCDQPRLR